MRKTQLDASTPRPMRGSKELAPGEQPRVNYYLPLVATLLASIMVVLFVALLTFSASTFTARLLGDTSVDTGGSIIAGGLCGLVALLCAGATIFFAWSVVKVVRDFFTPMEIKHGVVMGRQPGRGMGGANWVSIRFVEAPQVSTNSTTRRTATTGTGAGANLASTGGAAPRAIEAGNLSFGAQLQEVAGSTGRNARPAEPEEEHDEAPRKGKTLRVDKHIYDALAVGDDVVVAFSRHIEHVYYVERLSTGGNNLFLRNLSLV